MASHVSSHDHHPWYKGGGTAQDHKREGKTKFQPFFSSTGLSAAVFTKYIFSSYTHNLFCSPFFFPSAFEGSQNPDESSISFPITFMYKDVPMQFVYYRKAETPHKSCICVRMSTSTRKPRWGQKLHLMMSTARSTQRTHLHTLNSVQQLLQFIVRFMKHVHPQAVIRLSNFTALSFQHFSVIHKLKPRQRPCPQANCRSFSTQSLSVVLSFPKHLTCVKLCYVFH